LATISMVLILKKLDSAHNNVESIYHLFHTFTIARILQVFVASQIPAWLTIGLS